MLIPTRRIGEKLVIGEDITISISEIVGNQVRVAIKAPKHIAVHREEVFKQLKQDESGKVISFAK